MKWRIFKSLKFPVIWVAKGIAQSAWREKIAPQHGYASIFDNGDNYLFCKENY
jgi:hypothetical protein